MSTPVRPNQCVGSEFDTAQAPTLRIKGPMQNQAWPFGNMCTQATDNGLMVDKTSPNGVGLWVDPVYWAAFPTNQMIDSNAQAFTANAGAAQASDFSFTINNTSKFPMHYVLTTTFLARGTLQPFNSVALKLWFTNGSIPTPTNWAAQPFRDSRYSPKSTYGAVGYHMTVARTRTFAVGPNASTTVRRIMYIFDTVVSGTTASSNNLWQVITTGHQYVPRPANFLGNGAVVP